MGPFIVATHIGEVAYHLDLKGQFTCVQSIFHVNLLRGFVAAGNGIKPPEPIEVDNT